MNSELNLLQTAISAMQKQEYPRAIDALEAFCRHNTNSKPIEYFEAQRWLIKAYQRNGQVNLAVYLCQQMTDSPNAQTKSWAKSNLQWLQDESTTSSASVSLEIADNLTTSKISATENLHPSISVEVQDLTEILGNTDPAYLLSPEEVGKLFKDGQKALKMGRFAESIEKLEAVCAGVESSHKDLPQAQMSLVKAYQGSEQIDRALSLCRHLKASDKEYVQIWATEFLTKLTPDLEIESTPPIVVNPSSSSAWVESDADEDAESDEAAMSEAGEPEQGQIKSLNQSATAKLELASQITLSLVIGAVVAMVVVFISTIMTKQQPTPTNPVGAMMTNSP